MANLTRAVVLVASMTLTIVGVGPVEPQSSPWDAGYFPNARLIAHDSHMIHSYDLIRDTHVLGTFVATDEKDDCSLEAAKLPNDGDQHRTAPPRLNLRSSSR